MKQAALTSRTAPNQSVASPCIEVCKMSSATGYCEGCHRTVAEIAGWSDYSDEQKRAVLARLPARGYKP